MTRFFITLSAFGFLALAAQADDLQTIGLIEADFEGEALSQSTMSFVDEGQRLATASLSSFGPLTALVIYGAEGSQITIEAMFGTAEPDPQSAVQDVTVAYFPSGAQGYWTSEGAPEPARITFERLETQTEELHATGAFEALLCWLSEETEDADTTNCQLMTGRFDTELIRE